MKAAFHFNAFHPSLGSNYGNNVEKLLFKIILSSRNLHLSSKILTGDLLLSNLAYDVIKTSKSTETRKFNQDKYFKIVNRWLKPENTIWSSMIRDRLMQALNDEIFTICFETIEIQLANYLDGKLREKSEAYLGAMEVDDGSHIHCNLYSNSIGVRYRINNKTASVFWDSMCEESRDESTIERLKLIGFKRVSFRHLRKQLKPLCG